MSSGSVTEPQAPWHRLAAQQAVQLSVFDDLAEREESWDEWFRLLPTGTQVPPKGNE